MSKTEAFWAGLCSAASGVVLAFTLAETALQMAPRNLHQFPIREQGWEG